MEKRLFILGSKKFPRGSAGANYEQYFSLALMEKGWKVIILGTGLNRTEDFDGKRYVYKGIEYFNNSDSVIVKYGMELKFYKQMAEKYHFTKNDYFVLRNLGWAPQNWLKKFGTNHISYIHFDDLQPSQFKMAFINPRYWLAVYKWHVKFRRFNKAFPISEALEDEEKRYNCKTLRLPIMADPDEYGESVRTTKPNVLQFIYSGAKLNGCEDDIELMFQAFSILPENIKSKIKFHVTGASEEKLRSKLNNPCIIDQLKDVLIFHKWMDYSELIDLYRNMDFLILARFDNKLTQSNFPSKLPESMSFGIVPICSRVGDYARYYLQDSYDSIFFEVGKVEACQRAIIKAVELSEEEFLRMRSNARKTAVNKFGYKQWSDRINDFLLL